MDTILEQFITQAVSTDTRQARQLIRRQQIAETVVSNGSVRIEDIAQQFSISLMTAHRDLDELERRGLLRKDRGVATVMPSSVSDSSDAYRVGQQPGEKKQIAKTAAEFLEPGETVFLDDSTTVLQMVPYLRNRMPLTAITNSITLMNALRDIEDLDLIGLGGRYQSWCNAFLGHMTINEIRGLYADTVVLSISAIIDGVAFHQSPEMVETKTAMFNAASRRILLADHT
ncbi:MAG: DeoR/GlpR family DNA-binding transcription regulator, partial [Natronospirillum sp.]